MVMSHPQKITNTNDAVKHHQQTYRSISQLLLTSTRRSFYRTIRTKVNLFNFCQITSSHSSLKSSKVNPMLILHEHMADIYLHSEASKHSKAGSSILSIRNLININDMVVIQNLLFNHAWSGCDTTSVLFSQEIGFYCKETAGIGSKTNHQQNLL